MNVSADQNPVTMDHLIGLGMAALCRLLLLLFVPQCSADCEFLPTRIESGCFTKAYRRLVPISGCLCKKLLDLFFLSANISLKRNFGAIETGCFLLENENTWFYLRRKKILSTENNVRSNRDDSDHF
jgi:hypothetical protein